MKQKYINFKFLFIIAILFDGLLCALPNDIQTINDNSEGNVGQIVEIKQPTNELAATGVVQKNKKMVVCSN